MPTATLTDSKSRGDSVYQNILSFGRAAAFAILAFAAAPAAIAQEATVRETHGAWEVRCAGETCFMIQVASDANGAPVLSFAVRKLDTPRTEGDFTFIAAAEIYTKPGVFLPAGVTFSVDGNDSRRIPYERCFPEGCAALPLVQQTLIDSLKGGARVTVTVYPNPGEEVSAEVSLSGFTAAYDSL